MFGGCIRFTIQESLGLSNLGIRECAPAALKGEGHKSFLKSDINLIYRI